MATKADMQQTIDTLQGVIDGLNLDLSAAQLTISKMEFLVEQNALSDVEMLQEQVNQMRGENNALLAEVEALKAAAAAKPRAGKPVTYQKPEALIAWEKECDAVRVAARAAAMAGKPVTFVYPPRPSV